MAFTQTNVRLIAGYSSIAQLGFITLGIFSLRADGADGAVLQMVNHGLVVAGIFIVIAILYERTRTEELPEMGGQATRAPLLAALFLIVTLATLAMPGSANFIGEFYILNGVFQAKIVYAFVAGIGVALAAFYALRLYQRTMHNRLPAGAQSREIGARDACVLAPLVACIVALALWPGLILERGEASVNDTIEAVAAPSTGSEGTAPEVTAREMATFRSHSDGIALADRSPIPPPSLPRPQPTAMTFNAPDIDYAGISPIIALTAGVVLVLLAGLVGSARSASGSSSRSSGSARWRPPRGSASGSGARSKDLVAGALRLDDLALSVTLIAIASAAFCIPLSWREESVERPLGPAGHGEFQALLLCSVLGMTLIAQAQNLIAFFVALELLSIPLYVLCGSAIRREAVARVGPQVPDHRLARLGDAALRPRLRLRRHRARPTSTRSRDAIGGSVLDDPLLLIGIALAATGLAFKLSIAPFHQWTPDVYQGAPDPGHRVHGGGDQGGGVRGRRALLRGRARARGRRLAAGARGARGGLDRGRQRRRARPALAQAPARLLGRRPGRLHDGRGRRRQRGRGERARLLSRRLRADEPGRVRGDHDPRARDAVRRRHPLGRGPRRASARRWRPR